MIDRSDPDWLLKKVLETMLLLGKRMPSGEIGKHAQACVPTGQIMTVCEWLVMHGWATKTRARPEGCKNRHKYYQLTELGQVFAKQTVGWNKSS